MDEEEQKKFVPIMEFFLSQKEIRPIAYKLIPDMLEQQMLLGNTIFVQNVVNMKDKTGKYYFPISMRRSFSGPSPKPVPDMLLSILGINKGL